MLLTSARGLERVAADGSTLPVLAYTSGSQPQFSPDGRWIVFVSRGNLVSIPAAGDTTQRVLLDDPGIQLLPALSPDGKWLAYASDESGTFQVYVRPFPDTKRAKWQVSVTNGYAPRWSRSGRELFFIDGNELYVAAVEPTAVFRADIPKRLFRWRLMRHWLPIRSRSALMAGGFCSRDRLAATIGRRTS